MTGTTEWLTLGDASRALGVPTSTLRNWTDQGRIRCFRTPGGHRRFAAEDVRALRHAMHKESLPAGVDRAMTDPNTAASIVHIPDYCRHLPPDVRDRSQEFGRELLALAIQHITRPEGDQVTLDRVTSVGREQGRLAARSGLTAGQTVEMFWYCSQMVQDAIVPLSPEYAPIDAPDLRRNAALQEIFRAVLYAVMVGYEDRTAETR